VIGLQNVIQFLDYGTPVLGRVLESAEGQPGRWATISGRPVWLPGTKLTRLCKPEEGHVYEISCEDGKDEHEVHYRKPNASQRFGYDKQHIATAPTYEAACSVAGWHSKALGKRADESQPSDDIAPDKAKEILRDGTVHGRPLTDAQRGMFGAAAGQADESAQPFRQLVLELWSPSHPRVLELASSDWPASDYSTRIDADSQVIRDVKLLGVQSRNTGRVLGLDPIKFGEALERPYGYTADGLRAALPLYEDAAVFLDHRPFDFDQSGARIIKTSERSASDLLGVMRNVRFADGDGIRGDFYYLSTHPFVPQLLETARKFPRKLAFSQEAGYDDPVLRDGQIWLSRITDVDGIALIASKPGTTAGLFESLAMGV
jgi:hypothetical protein